MEFLPSVYKVLGVSPPPPHTVGVAGHTCNPTVWEVEAKDKKFKIILSSRSAWTTQNLVSKIIR